MAVAVAATGVTSSTNGSAPAPALVGSEAAGDVMIATFYSRENVDGTVSLSAGWTQFANHLSSGGLIALWWRAWQSGDTAPTYTLGNHTSGTTGDSAFGRIIRITGADTTNPIRQVTTPDTNASSNSIGPISGLGAATFAGGLACVYGGKRLQFLSTIAVLSGDGVTWAKQFDTSTANGADAANCHQTAQTPSAATITAKTYTDTGNPDTGKGLMYEIGPPGYTPVGGAPGLPQVPRRIASRPRGRNAGMFAR